GASDRVVGPSPSRNLVRRSRRLRLTARHTVYYNTRNTNEDSSRSSPGVTLDYLSIISNETSRIVNAFERDRQAAVPWSDRWTVATVARHVAATHHVVAEIVEGRPGADFGLFGQLQTPPKDSPEF